MTTDPTSEWMGTPEVARTLGLANRTVYRLIDSGALAGYRFGRVIRCRRADVVAYVEAHRIRPGDLRHLYGEDPDGEERNDDI
jgi:excisionase family DNA binding protein